MFRNISLKNKGSNTLYLKSKWFIKGNYNKVLNSIFNHCGLRIIFLKKF